MGHLGIIFGKSQWYTLNMAIYARDRKQGPTYDSVS